MNYLGHLYLSGNDEKIMVGNFIGDYVKGRNMNNFQDKIRQGIILHRQIDAFTDRHPKVLEAKKLFRSEYGLYSGIIVDFLYDHFLASNWFHYSPALLKDYSKQVHSILLSNYRILPLRVQGFLPFLIQNRRLESYASVDGIFQSVKIMSNHTSLPDKTNAAKKILLENYEFLADNFMCFMADIMEHVTISQNVVLQKPLIRNRI
ncbi:MAG: DUF479 domain-containing protein [Prolixibacteraceae bacterium]|nr:DUF479 domain-containing protein [Prolixibacteraceae bacterium]